MTLVQVIEALLFSAQKRLTVRELADALKGAPSISSGLIARLALAAAYIARKVSLGDHGEHFKGIAFPSR